MKFILLALFSCSLLLADDVDRNWPNWRGPDQNGVAQGSNYPTTWSKTDHVLWKLPMDAPASSTPIVWGDTIFVAGAKGDNNLAMAIDLEGNILWETELGTTRSPKNKKAGSSNSSPVTDGKHVYFYYKSGDLACVDFDGKVQWETNLQDKFQKDNLWWDLGTSPVLTSKHVVIACMQDGPSYVAAFDKQSGEVAWKVDRTFKTKQESDQSYTTPIVSMHDGQETVVVMGADHVTAHDAKTGKQIWVCGKLNPTNEAMYRSISSPVLNENMVIAPYSRGASLTAIRLGGEGDVSSSHIVWDNRPAPMEEEQNSQRGNRRRRQFVKGEYADVPCPAVKDGKIYISNERGNLVCLEAKTGKELWTKQVEPSSTGYSSSPIIAGNHVYVTREDGTTFVVKVGDEPEVVAKNVLRENTYATPVFVHGKILIRTNENLYCIGQ